MQYEPLPDPMKHLRICPDRQIPVPWFVAWVGGKPEFRMADGAKFATAVRQNRCWVCGRRHEPGRVTFVVGPMCGLNRVSAEPPSHLECARYSARNCPFLTRPQMERRGHEEVAARGCSAGVMIARNPGVSLLWTAAGFAPFDDGRGGTLFRLREPLALEFWAEGRPATRGEVERSIESGLPILEKIAGEEGRGAVAALGAMRKDLDALLARWLPGEASCGKGSGV